MALDLRVEGGWRRWQGGLGLTNEAGDHRVTDDKWLSPATPGSSFQHELLCFPNANTNTNANTNVTTITNTNVNTIPTPISRPTATSRPTAALLPTTPLFPSFSVFLQFVDLLPVPILLLLLDSYICTAASVFLNAYAKCTTAVKECACCILVFVSHL